MMNNDADDNKFADLFISSNADFIVSKDSKLLALNKSEFPKCQVLKLHEFSEILLHMGKTLN